VAEGGESTLLDISRDPIRNVAIGIATYRRPQHLRSLLESIDAQEFDGFSVRLIVVDNDAEGSAREAAQSVRFPLKYTVEERPGIVAARNRTLDEVIESDDALVFVDDDEFADPKWLSELVRYVEELKADVVSGPVVAEFLPSTPEWISTGGYWSRARVQTGAEITSVATNNTLVRTALLRSAPHVRFDDKFRETGGSDTQFFRDLRPYATSYRWVDSALVYEWVLEERANARWLFRRAVRIGNVNARYRGRISSILGGILRVGGGAVLTLGDLIIKRRVRARYFNMAAHGVGLIGGAVGLDIREYRRSSSS